MRRFAFIAVVALQVIVLLLMAGSRAAIVSSGQEILLKAEPVDPRHPFMGDYVRLSYNISNIDLRLVSTDIAEENFDYGSKVYVVVEDQRGLYHAVGLYQKEPAAAPGQVVLQGRYDGFHDQEPSARDPLAAPLEKDPVRDGRPKFARIEYGLEEYYLPEGKGLELEQTLREQKNLYARVKVWRGDSVLTGLVQAESL
ncbi:GDYXXLXY domain-containing protein [Heliobacterium chlorum]|uniref:GDYXXLXY domain-containing protein n=1 Tax=Heliobacterium chlorum TaxID=2698 RepID=A0ABR7T5V3_HELCL|nr:GDYXXLXY domain-containing protein [Heliobacterium chlorum]MBC9785214.1 GDYXXLXY domain-containing protein [Heliobacterium chlorum]